MEWSLRVGRIFGFDLKIHYLNLALFAGLFLVDWSLGIALVSLFAFVLFHELGHCFMARAFGVGIRDIILFPLGGVARMENLPRQPKIEFLVALSGPAVNAAFVLILTPFMMHAHENGYEDASRLLLAFTAMNLFMAVFNMIPAYPMDGSRVLRAMLGWAGFGFSQATEFVSAIGKLLAVVMIAIGVAATIGGFVQFGVMLLFVAVFCWVAGEQERRMIVWMDARGLGGPSTYGSDAVAVPARRGPYEWSQGVDLGDGWRVYPGGIRVRIVKSRHPDPELASGYAAGPNLDEPSKRSDIDAPTEKRRRY